MRLIDADKLVKTFCSHCVDHDECKSECMDLKIIKSMKTVDAERHGHWVEKEIYDGNNLYHIEGECSVCHNTLIYNSNYCPWCGAKMEGVEE